MNQSETLRERFSGLNTQTLRDMWAAEARTEWAENILREELLERGVSKEELDDIATRREEIAKNAPPSARDTLWKFGFVGRMAALAAAVVAYVLFKLLFGSRAGTYAMTVVFAIYTVILVRRVSSQLQVNVSGRATFAMIWQCVEAVVISLAFIVFAATLPSYA